MAAFAYDDLESDLDDVTAAAHRGTVGFCALVDSAPAHQGTTGDGVPRFANVVCHPDRSARFFMGASS